MNYEISNSTLAIIPIDDNCCKVLETHQEFILSCSAFSIIKENCLYFGSTYSGRSKATKKLLGINYKTPIIIEEINNIIFFPLESPINSTCEWINANSIRKFYTENNPSKSIIEFYEGRLLEVSISLGSLTNQIIRSTRLQIILSERVKKSISKY